MPRPGSALASVLVCLYALTSISRSAAAQDAARIPDSIGVADTIADRGIIRLLTQPRRSRLAISSGKTYNRVEGLPVYFGPVFTDTVGPLLVGIDVFGILRSADTFRWDGGNVGHLVRTELRSP
jgi:hypothetical protein